jgi:hypothetical protein
MHLSRSCHQRNAPVVARRCRRDHEAEARRIDELQLAEVEGSGAQRQRTRPVLAPAQARRSWRDLVLR